ncbi:MAG: SusC/RagA family TonB-linked outer membrane protein, partial [Bacteroidales bacterium]|nr:SusC/RagA family TonB-linked outer membrane protein [Bacteroidales bacterium]
LPYVNFNEDKRSGLDFSLSHNNKFGDFEYEVGFVGMVYNTEVVKRDEVYDDEYQYRVGKSINASFGYVCEGFFANQAEIDNHATQTFGDVAPGNLKYKDVNGDGTVNSQDQVELGDYSSPFTYGINLTLKYKNWTLFARGQGQSGAIGYKNSSYYRVYGSGKYSEEILGRWTPETAESATRPRLSTTSNTNDYRNSTFWRYDNNRFDLTQVQLTYNLPKSVLDKTKLISQLSVYVLGQNLLTISKERKMMEMNIGSAPQCRFYNLGIKASF